MIDNSKEVTKYFKSAIAAKVNTEINFNTENFFIVDQNEMLLGKINFSICNKIFAESKKNIEGAELKNTPSVNIIICAKTLKNNFETGQKSNYETEELTGIFYIPAVLDFEGNLSYGIKDKKLPWFPREYLQPMIEPKLAIGDDNIVESFLSEHIAEIYKIEEWSEYVEFFKKFYEKVVKSNFGNNIIKNIDESETVFELQKDIYIFLDKSINSTFYITNLYNDLLKDGQRKSLYENFTSLKQTKTSPILKNDLNKMHLHSGQMSGEYPLSPSQREVVNHFNFMRNGDILAINGPPGTGKTTLLQTIVANMYVKRALEKEKAPLIVASSTNNQAVTNIIESFGNIKKLGILNLEERWIVGVSSFATYFPSAAKIKEAKKSGYQYTNQKGEFFVADLENNLKESKSKLIKSCNDYFKSQYLDITTCKNKLHEELLFVEKSKNALLSLAQEFAGYNLNEETIDKYLERLILFIEEKQTEISNIKQRIASWIRYYKILPWYVKFLKFTKRFSKKIQAKFRLFINYEESSFINEYMNIDDIIEKYSFLVEKCNREFLEIFNKKANIENIKNNYDRQLEMLSQHNINLIGIENKKYNLELNYLNDLLDKNHRYIEFWLAVHYYECRWVGGEDVLTEKQIGKNFKNVVEKFFNRLSMITPCLVMTFYMLPRQFSVYFENSKQFIFNYIDLLIVDEAGQVSPEIAAGSFSLAKMALVVGDTNQIEPVWSVSRALDKSLALSSKVIQSIEEFKLLEEVGLNCCCSSVMQVAAKSCKYEKFGEKGLFLSEHRRCYNEIIDYCNRLVYKGNLQPLRGEGKYDKKIVNPQWAQMSYKNIITDCSCRIGTSRCNQFEAEQIVKWVKNNFEFVKELYPNESEKKLIGIITPFVAQVACINKEFKKQSPDLRSNISVGTVHTFQGADRQIIILSTVYGHKENCFFIDEHKSLMNVAVSRAKDNFFVFGDIGCLKDSQNSPSGLLKNCLCLSID